MRLKARSSLLLGLVFSLCLGLRLQGQTLAQTEAIADKFMEDGNFYAAAKFYSRVYFFSDKSSLGRINGKLGKAYFGKRDFKRAYQHFDNAQKLEQNDTVRAEWFLRKTAALILQQKFKLALLEMLNYHGPLTEDQQKKYFFLKGTIYFGEEKFDLAKQNFIKALSNKDSASVARIDSLFQRKNILRPNPKTAKWLSIIMPGLGQMYAGDVKNGLNSFALNISLFYLFARDAIKFSFFESFIVFYPWIQRYYQGGFERAEKIARKKLRQKRAKVYREIHQFITNKL